MTARLELISDDNAAELADSILVFIGAEYSDDAAAGVIWMEEGNVSAMKARCLFRKPDAGADACR